MRCGALGDRVRGILITPHNDHRLFASERLTLAANKLPIKQDCDEKQRQSGRHDNRGHEPADHGVLALER